MAMGSLDEALAQMSKTGIDIKDINAIDEILLNMLSNEVPIDDNDLEKYIEFVEHPGILERIRDYFQPEVIEKSATASTCARNKANEMYNRPDHSKTDHKNIALLYNCSIAYAPNNSKELALSYNNRSVFLHHIKEFGKAIIDIERALKITQSAVLRAKLLCRKFDCLLRLGWRNEANAELKIAKSQIDAIKDEQVKAKVHKMLRDSLMNYKVQDIKPFMGMELPKLKRNRLVPCTSEDVEFVQDGANGRTFRAAFPINAGHFIAIEPYHAGAPQVEQLHLACSNCLNIAWCGVPCDHCPSVIFCTPTCKDEAWAKFHEFECPILKHLAGGKFFRRYALLVLRVILTAVKESGPGNNGIKYLLDENESVQKSNDKFTIGFTKNKLDTSRFRAICSLRSYNTKDQEKNSKVFSIAVNIYLVLYLNPNYNRIMGPLANYLPKRISKNQSAAFKNLIIELMCKMNINAFTFSGDDCTCNSSDIALAHELTCTYNLGNILAPVCGFVKHSCVPNARAIQANGKTLLYTLRPIEKGEEILISYATYLLQEKSERQEYLRKIYGLECECIACKENWPSVFKNEREKDRVYGLLLDWLHSLALKYRISHEETQKSVEHWSSFMHVAFEARDMLQNIYRYKNSDPYIAETESLHFRKIMSLGYSKFFGSQLKVPESC